MHKPDLAVEQCQFGAPEDPELSQRVFHYQGREPDATQCSRIIFVHRLLAIGLAEIAQRHPDHATRDFGIYLGVNEHVKDVLSGCSAAGATLKCTMSKLMHTLNTAIAEGDRVWCFELVELLCREE